MISLKDQKRDTRDTAALIGSLYPVGLLGVVTILHYVTGLPVDPVLLGKAFGVSLLIGAVLYGCAYSLRSHGWARYNAKHARQQQELEIQS